MSWIDALGDQLLGAVLVYGYPALAGLLIVGALGLPVPSGLATAVVGTLVAQGRLNLAVAGLVALGGLAGGDLAGYFIGLRGGRALLERYGHWLGLTPVRLVRAERLFDDWGPLSLFATRTILSGLGSPANLVAGASRFGVLRFLFYEILGRLLWVAGYLGLGYAFGNNVEAAVGLPVPWRPSFRFGGRCPLGGNEEVREVIPADCTGVLGTDRASSYDATELAGVKQQKCVAHLQALAHFV